MTAIDTINTDDDPTTNPVATTERIVLGGR